MVTLADIRHKRSEILNVAARHGASNVRLFGSVIRGESGETSDVDLLVHMDQGRSLLDRIELIQELEDLLHCKVDVVNERALHRMIRDRILAEGMPL